MIRPKCENKNRLWNVVAIGMWLSGAACGSEHEGLSSEQLGPTALSSAGDFRSGISVVALLDPTSDTTMVRYEIAPCAGGVPLVIERSLEDQVAPGTDSNLADQPLDALSQHRFSAVFQLLESGCYDLLAIPLQADAQPSLVCAPAHKSGVLVTGGQTTQVQLLMQCSQSDKAAIDALAILNHPPFIDNIQFEDGHFVCGTSVGVCIAATDVDNDPLEFELEVPAGCALGPTTSVQGHASATGLESCFELSCDTAGQHALTARVFDQLHDDSGQLLRIEDWLALEGYAQPSRSELAFHAYFDCLPADDGQGFAPVSVSFAGVSQHPADRLIDGSGLGDGDLLEARLHTPGFLGNPVDAANFKAPASEILGHPIDFDLGGLRSFSELVIWNYTHADLGEIAVDLRDIEVSVSVNGVDYNFVQTISLATSGTSFEFAQVIPLSSTATHLRLQAVSGHGDPLATGQSFGLGEVRLR